MARSAENFQELSLRNTHFCSKTHPFCCNLMKKTLPFYCFFGEKRILDVGTPANKGRIQHKT